jgi:hypothetical protein
MLGMKYALVSRTEKRVDLNLPAFGEPPPVTGKDFDMMVIPIEDRCLLADDLLNPPDDRRAGIM